MDNINTSKNLLLSVDNRFIKLSDGTIWANAVCDVDFWDKYLQCFDKVFVIARVKNGKKEEVEGWLLSSRENVNFLMLPYFNGPIEYAKSYIKVLRKIKILMKNQNYTCSIIRLPSITGFAVYKMCKRFNIVTGLEVVCNLSDKSYYTNGYIEAFLYWLMSIQLKKACLTSDGVSYVTKEAIQKNYPPNPDAIISNYSSIDLFDESYLEPVKKKIIGDEIRLIHVSTISLLTKGQDILIKAVKILLDKGYNVKALIVGGGRYKEVYERLAKDMEIESAIIFTGNISSKEELHSLLYNSDIFVFPTQTEGLPRVLLEAMAYSLPCISTPVGGIPELLDKEYLLDPFDVNAFAEKIEYMINNPKIVAQQKNRNYDIALKYKSYVLNEKRKNYFERLISLNNKKSNGGNSFD